MAIPIRTSVREKTSLFQAKTHRFFVSCQWCATTMISRMLSRSLGSLRSLNAVQTAQYHEKVIDHYENPRNVGTLDKKSMRVGTGLVGAPECGDVMRLQIEVDDNGKIINAKFKTFGCGSAIASSSLATEWVKGKTLDQALGIKNTDIAKELCLPPIKLHCSMLAEDALKAALSDYRLKQQKANAEQETKEAAK
ncbi:uncharacterized protein LOC111259008 [Varroa jacobsoni]|uniref:Iron-sulfur cluster assembly enzyme ISCU n=1 Tax=Varroa destructor TaxID=109461 RepID=A0A7M7JIK5_VARDE|nr:uncharacterized protein LOC111246811 isoform X2 [Varroa destructor]XP_022686408.1 uncharacterized protein LOC111259008 [Varroa jacobsoni]